MSRRDLLKQRLARARGRSAGTSRPGGISPRPPDVDVPLSPAQERLWFLERLLPGRPLYNIARSARLRGKLNAVALADSWRRLLARHEALRSVVEEVDGAGRQRALSAAAAAVLPTVDLTALPSSRRSRHAEGLARREALRPFALDRSAAARAVLVRVAPEDHELLLSFHHLFMDGWSWGVVRREWGILYAAAVEGREADLPPAPLQFGDVAYWQAQRLREQGGSPVEALDRAIDWWRQQLAGLTPLALMADRPRSSQPSLEAAYRPLRLAPELVERLTERGRGEGVSLFMTLLAGWVATLGRWSAADDLCVGAPVAGRDRRELESVVGFFVNTVALRFDLGGDPSLEELTMQARRVTLDAMGHAEVPFARVVQEVAPDRSQGVAPLFQVSFSLQNADPGSAAAQPWPGLGEPEFRFIHRSLVDQEWTLGLEPASDGSLAGHVLYRRDLYDATTAERFVGRFQRALDALVRDPSHRLSRVPLLAPSQRWQLAAEWAGPTIDAAQASPRVDAVVEVFRHARSAPDDIVLEDLYGETWSYLQLTAAAAAFGEDLHALGVRPAGRDECSIVALCLPRSPELVVAALGCAWAGVAYLPMDPALPSSRLRYMVEDAAAAALVSATDEPFEGLTVGRLEPPGVRPSDPTPPPAPRAVAPDTLAYVIYTSGSTGRPKGTLLPRRGLAELLHWHRREFQVGPGTRSSLVAGVGFDAAVWELWSSLVVGETVVIMPAELLADPSALVRWLGRKKITHCFLPTSVGEALMDLPESEALPLRVLWVGGEQLHRGASPTAPFRVVNCYGPTECTVITISGTMTTWPTTPDIGRPLPAAGTWIFEGDVLGSGGSLAPLGVPGEICLAGTQLGRGYLQRPGRTAESFIPHPLAGRLPGVEAGARLYRTGDLGRWLGDGRVDFLGRRDHQVKIRGFRVELGEVEARLTAHPRVADAAVLARAGATGVTLAAYVVPRREATAVEASTPVELDPELLRTDLAQELPDYMVPTSFAFLDALPLNASGKVDRKALARVETRSLAQDRWVAPRGPLEELVAGVYEELLGTTEPVGALDDFFHLGGHSLLAVKLVTRLAEVGGAEVPLDVLFEDPSVAAVARALERQRRSAESTPELVPSPAGAPPAPLSFAQESLWMADRLDPGSALYNVPTALRLRGRLDVEALGRGLNALVQRHRILRTILVEVEVEGEPETDTGPPAGAPTEGPADVPVAVQRVLDPPSAALPTVDLGVLPPSLRQRLGRRLLERGAAVPFDLAAQGPVRWFLLRLASDEHLLCLSLHHVATDGWSTGLLLTDLEALYGAFVAGRPNPLAPLTLHYGDFARWQRGWLRGEELERRLAPWLERLADLPVLQLPTDRPRPPVRRPAGGRRPLRLAPATAAALRARGRSVGATPFMGLVAAFGALLSRLTGQRDVPLGTPMAARSRRPLEPVVGFFVNPVVLRLDLGGEPSFEGLLGRVRERVLEAVSGQDVPFDRLVGRLVKQRDFAHTPLFQGMVILQNAPMALPRWEGLEAQPEPFDIGLSKFDLTLAAAPVAGEAKGEEPGLGGWWVYPSALFDATTVDRLNDSFVTLLAAALEDPKKPLAALPLLSVSQRHQTLVEWPAPRPAYGLAPAVHLRVLQVASERPAAVALRSEGRSVSYGELSTRALTLAAELRRRGVGPEVRVALFLERGVEAIGALLAVLAAGGAYVPLDPSNPAERLRLVLEDCGASLVLSHSSLATRLGKLGVAEEALPTLLLDELTPPSDEAPLPEPVTPHTESAAYVLYTSGSTGRPKGVVISHGALANRLEYARRVDFNADDAFLQKTTLAFDVSVVEIFGPLVAGGRIVIARSGEVADTAYLLDLMAREGVTQASFPPTLLLALLEQGSLDPLRRLHTVVTGGETVPAELPAVFHHHLKADLLNRYGPTEATISVTSWRCLRGARPRVLPIGRATAQARLAVMDRRGEALPAGATGELAIGGPSLARGYLGDARRTAAAFVPDPYCAEPGARRYRSGDLVRYRGDGALEFVGRVDRQVKVRGFRVELGEIEAALRALPGVEEAVVRDFGSGEDKRLAAYWTVSADGGGETAPRRLRDGLTAALPPYMVPDAWVPMKAFPLSPTGKIDRQALDEPRWEGVPGASADGSAAAAVAPRNAVEQQLAELWQQVLGREVGVTDDFFELGGHSLMATRLMGRVRRAFGADLPLRALFEGPTIESLARRLAARPDALAPPLPIGGDASSASISQAPGDAVVSFAQARLWFLDQLQPGSTAYNIPAFLRLETEPGGSALEPRWLAGALTRVVAHHRQLRAVFGGSSGEPRVSFVAPAPVPLPVVDLSALPPAQRWAHVRWLGEMESQRPFDLRRGPLFRALLLRADNTLHGLLLDIHHIVFDGWSMGILTRDLSTAYQAQKDGQEPRLEPPETTYSAFARRQREQVETGTGAGDLEWWRQHLAKLPEPLELPMDRPRPPRMTFEGAQYSQVWPRGLEEAVQAFARASQATPFVVYLAALGLTLGRLSGRSDLVLGTPSAGREDDGVENLVGFFINTLPLRLEPSPAVTFQELVASVRESVFAAFSRQGVPFERLVEEVAQHRDLSRNPLFEVIFNHHTQEPPKLRLAGVMVAPESLVPATAKLDVSFAVRSVDDGLRAVVDYRSVLFDSTTTRRMLERFRRLLEGALAAPESPAGELPWLAPSERQQVLREWGHGQGTDPHPPSVTALLAKAAARYRQRLALVGADGAEISYGHLDAWTAALARTIAAARRDGDRESPVAVLLERGPQELACLWAVWRAGAPYLPLDPAWPKARARYVLADTEASLLISRPEMLADLADSPPGSESAEAFSLPRLLEPPPLVDAIKPVAGEPPADPGSALDPHPEALAYVIYTSGSTGRPKGVKVSHGALAQLLDWRQRTLPVNEESRSMRSVGQAFDASVVEVWPYLTRGASLHFPDDATRVHVPALRDFIVQRRLDLVKTATPIAEALVELEWPAESTLRYIFAGGEALRRRPSPQAPFRLINVYGPTESTVLVTAAWVAPTDAGGRAPSLGRPVGSAEVHIVDGHMDPVALGSPGEVVLGGLQLARGYHGRPAETAVRFRPDPFSPTLGARLYITGDRGRYRSDGRLDFLGRLDEQVKIRGYRIEPGEVEGVLEERADITEAAVAAVDSPTGPRLVAWVVAPALAPSDDVAREAWIERLLQELGERLPNPLVPSAVVVMESMPRTANDKVDWRALPEPSAQRREGAVEPRSPLEGRVLELWQELLGTGDETSRLGVTDGFFDHGGHSLAATRLLARLEMVFGVRLALASFFEEPTVAGLAALLKAQGVEAAAAGAPAVAVSRPSWLVPLAEGPLGEGADAAPVPLVLIHGAGGAVAAYGDLAAGLEGRRAVWAVEAPELSMDEDPEAFSSLARYNSLGSLAHRYRAALEDEALSLGAWSPSTGSIPVLGGWSMGGLLAFEMARQRRVMGRPTGALVLIDSVAPEFGLTPADEMPRDRLARHFVHHAGVSRELAQRLARGETPPEARDEVLLFNSMVRDVEAARSYRPGTSVEISAFLALAQEASEADAESWHPWVGSLTVHHAPGHHFSLIQGAAGRRLGAMVADYLDALEAPAPESVSVTDGDEVP